MVKICPVSLRKVNENLSRLNAGFTCLMVLLFFLTGWHVVALVIVGDFLLRNIFEGKINPVIRLNKYIINVAHLPRHMINAGPKIFAARVGLILSGIAAIFLLAGNTELSMIILGILGVFSFMESAFNYCVACKLYPFVLPLNRLFE